MSRYPTKYPDEIWHWNHPRVGAGPEAAVFQISPDRIIKFRTSGEGLFRKILKTDWAVSSLYSEDRFVSELLNRGISVPKSIGVYTVPLKTFRPPFASLYLRAQYYPGIVMQHIDGIFIEDAPEDRQAELKSMAFAEITKAIDAGLRYVGKEYEKNWHKNILWVPDKDEKEGERRPGKIYLTGFKNLFCSHFEKIFPEPQQKSN